MLHNINGDPASPAAAKSKAAKPFGQVAVAVWQFKRCMSSPVHFHHHPAIPNRLYTYKQGMYPVDATMDRCNLHETVKRSHVSKYW